MWTTVLVMAVAVSFEPIRIGLTVMMLNRPRPMRQLLAFLCGGFAMGLGVGLVVLFILRHTLFTATNLTLPKVQIVIGLLALLIAAVLATNISTRQFKRAPLAGAAVGAVVAEPTPSSALDKVSTRLLRGRSLWVAGVAGLGIAGPSVDYLAALAVIVASGAAPAVQAGALLTFNVVAFALVEIPLVSYLIAPDKTRALMAALHDWIRSRRRREVAALLAAAGCVMLAVGVIGL
jgi:Sap, sulfolipid-1-addressing protein